MNTEPLGELEQHLSAACHSGAPAELRLRVLNDVERELRAACWDRRLARAAIILLLIGVGMNASLAWQADRALEQSHRQLAQQSASDSLVETAIVVAEATNAETAQVFARQLAALRGRELTDQEIASIDAATNRDQG